MSADTLRREGRIAYGNGEYDKALDLFRRAVKRGDPSATLLDHLAATHEKLNDLDDALKAAKKTIQTWREHPTGYLRAGRILVKMGKKSTALDIYNQALKVVKHVGIGYEELKKAQADVLKDVAPPKSVDPLTVLPREMALMVLEYLSFRQRTAISRVSKGWRDFIRSEPNLWRHLDLTGARARVLNKFISAAINTAYSKLEAATLNRLNDFDKVLAALASRPSLQSLTLLETGLQGQNLVDVLRKAKGLRELRILHGTDISQTVLHSLARQHSDRLELLQCARVRHISFGSTWHFKLPMLTTLDLTADTIDAILLCANLSENSPKLRSLTLRELTTPTLLPDLGFLDLRQCQNLEYVRLRLRFTSPQQLTLPPSVKVLDLATSCGGSYVGSNFFISMEGAANDQAGLKWSRLPNLLDVKLHFPGAILSDVVGPFNITHYEGKEIPDISKLESLCMVNPNIPSNTILLEERLIDLEHWAITGCLDLKDDHVESMIRSYKKLRSLDFSGSSITGIAIKEIVKAGHVKELVANDCLQVGRDAVDWARAQGLKVQFGNTSNQITGKKVRY
ncbi:F-box/TPR repeat protein pof3 [Fulvia fulva]|uniref:F-box/TPR repeat protein pof3 n=1 Tax=Passalora fulva TaxID=5499 RepID=A0A9Q8LEF8_PASFU|nr:F-box/TPR repeat protein pof3 [Fulvia fulva]KAK4615351.1 F-box/TPR repeat protein pof3 [Fulvia fulva]KAK4616870.1 F-box/TPR repeat protein pof3 [Fulvia fulva]UJO15911.1 F-box/TPR repeat protein pof3 [Fulvia fulva]WPV18924.1 F-box/TPR repeat protein pof3 [Fulvia fulva]WPV34271.1 F-box/TPR repeat protein pof3 [Fulvia fulva]